ncbi:MAG: SDR family oxidoreductase [Ignavibacteria bacterium]|nr:SDR family oxidoreductase [Ignavibacteria bacterium]
MIIITGASRGIGKYLMEEFLKLNKKVIGTYFKENSEFEKNPLMYRLDITDIKSTEKFAEDIKDYLIEIILINCAGNNYNSFAHKSSPEEWSKVINTNLTGTYNIIRVLLPVMREQGYGRIINFSSIVAQTGIPGTSAYAASKAGLWGMTRSMAAENAGKGITINCLNLGYFEIGMITEVSDEYQAIVKKKIPTGKFGDPKNILNAINFLIGSDYINGSTLDINGAIS